MRDKNNRTRYRVESRRYSTGLPKNSPIQITHLDGKPLMMQEDEKNILQKLSKRIPRIQDPAQKRAGRNLAMFLAMILILTFIARGTAAATLAEISTVRAGADEIMQSVKTTGTVHTGGSIEQTAPKSIKVKEVLVSPGQPVQPGDSLLLFNLEEVEEQLSRAQVKLQEDNVKLEKLLQETPLDDSELTDAKKNLKWAQEDYNDAKSDEDKKVSAAQKELDSANAALSTAQNQLVQANKQAAAQTPAPTAEPSEEGEEEEEGEEATQPQPITLNNSQTIVQEAQEAVSSAQSAVSSAKEALTAAQQERDSALKTAERELEKAKDAVAKAEQTQEKTNLENENTDKQNAVDAETAKLDIQSQQKIVDELQALKDAEGVFTATEAGSVASIPEVGAEENVAVKLADTSGGYEVEGTVSKDDAKSLTVGMEAEIADTSGSIYGSTLYTGTIKEISDPDEANQVKIIILLPDGNWEQGKTLEIRVVKDSMTHSTCVPLAAVRSNSTGNYVLITEQRTTVLGTENVLVEIPVNVLMTGDDSAAIEGALSGSEEIVLDSTKPVSAGDRVRVTQ